MGEVMDAPETRERQKDEPLAKEFLDRLMRESKFTREDSSNPDTTIEYNGEKFTIEMVPDGKSETLTDVQNLFIETFGSEEVDPEEILRIAVDGKYPWGAEAPKYCVHVVKDSKGEVVSTLTGGRLQLKDGSGNSLSKQMFMVAYAVTAEKARQGGLAREAYISAIQHAAQEALKDGEQLAFSAGEAVNTSEQFWNSVGWQRVYGERAGKQGYEELRYIQPALDFNKTTGEPTEDAGIAPEHLMINSFEGGKMPGKEDVLATVRAFYTWCNTWPQEMFESPQALAKHQEHVVGIWKEFKAQVESMDDLVYLDKKTRQEMEGLGINIEAHSAADEGEAGPEDF